MLRLIKVSVGSVLAGSLAVVGLGGLNLYTYQRLTGEVPVASVSFRERAPDRFEATLVLPQQDAAQTLVLEGDEWQLDVRMIKWKDWLTFLGRDPLYRLDRISGRFSDIDRARSTVPSVHPLGEPPGIDLWAFARDGADWVPGIDAAYGSSVFVPMRDGQRYSVTLSRTGLVARLDPGPQEGS